MNQRINVATAAPAPEMKLFYACIIALFTTAIGFFSKTIAAPRWTAG